ncbi:DNA fragmentation factor subunit beta [Bombina bombina]|uniref:DNA fragmentation factor subunit beta n=1 Tax=Bombina bombina TaxID=8345 RepID=UPI00235B118E|nr:DNA fragmentation factor subunit beta [Bombina bombina]
MGSSNSMQMKIFKIRTLKSNEKYGIACKDLKELKQKGCKKFQLPLSATRVCLYDDGTEVSDQYLKRIPDNTELVLLREGETWQGCITDIDRFLNAFYKKQTDIVEAAKKLLSDENAPQRQKMLVDFIHNLNENIMAESREEDKPWFEGIELRFKNKSSYMRYTCESRIRSYMKEVERYSIDPVAKDEYKRIAEIMCSELKAIKYNGSYFDRMEQKTNRLCTSEGWFSCQGAFDIDACTLRHSINPYSNRESRVLFSTWNLDHIIEKKRSIVPCLAKAIKERNGREINWPYFFNLLFTTENLKLVHIACHKKTSHNLSCDCSMIYRKRKKHKNSPQIM